MNNNIPKELIHKDFKDLVNNFAYFHQKVKKEDLKRWVNLPPTYENYKHLDNIKSDIVNNPQKYIETGPITVRCKASELYTCDSMISKLDTIITYDRLYEYDVIVHKAKAFMEIPKGFSPKSDILHGMVRWIYDENNNVVDFAICKDRGNLRTHIGLASNAGDDVNLCITLDFHDVDPSMKSIDYIKMESETFMEDAVDRRGFAQDVKFRAGYVAGRKEMLAKVGFLDEDLDVDYAGIVSKIRKQNDKPAPEYSISSLAEFNFTKDGVAAGYISKYGIHNIQSAVGLLKSILKEREAIAKEHGKSFVVSKELSMSAIHTFTKSFWYLCETPAKLALPKSRFANAITTRDTLFDLIKHVFTGITFKHNFNINMKDLIKDSYTKDTTYFAFKTYMGPILPDLAHINGREYYGYRSNHPCLLAYINDCSEKSLRAEATKVVDNN